LKKRKRKRSPANLYFAEWGPKMGFPSKVTILLPHTYTESRTKNKRKTGKKKKKIKKINGIKKVTKNN